MSFVSVMIIAKLTKGALGEVETAGLMEEIKKLKSEYDFNKIIFGGLSQGDQFNDDSSEGSRIEKIKEQCLAGIKELDVDVEVAEEMLSTKMAQQNLLDSGKKMVSKKDNGESAKIILQGWLDGLVI